MMRMTCASFMQFYENVDMIRYEAFVIVAETKGVPRQRQRKWCHGNIPVPVTRLRYQCKGEVCGCVQKMVGRSRIPGVPLVKDGVKRGNN